MNVVISQPMYFPWIGLFEQINLSDVYFHLSNVQMPGGQSFLHRVQLKGPNESMWWSTPIQRKKFPIQINEVELLQDKKWKIKSIKTLAQIFAGLPHKNDAIDLVDSAINKNFSSLNLLNIYVIETICSYLSIKTRFLHAPMFEKGIDKSQRVLKIVKSANGTVYISGSGGKNYLDICLFAKEDIEIRFMDYKCHTYKQNFGEFNPYVSILHPIAALGTGTKQILTSQAIV